MRTFAEIASTKLNVAEWQIENSVELLTGGATIPFIARYRKDKTGDLTDVELIEIKTLFDKYSALKERKKSILLSLEESGNITDEIRKTIDESETLSDVEDIYLPFKPKRKTRAVIAKENGLESLAKMIMAENISDLEYTANKFTSNNPNINTTDDAIAGARDIIAEWVSEKQWVRKNLRQQFEIHATITSKVSKGKEEEAHNYRSWFDWSENASKAAPHRILAILRGEKEKLIKVKIEPDKDKAIIFITSGLVKMNTEASKQKSLAIKDSITRLIFPSLENEFRNTLKEKADEASIDIFGNNLKQLLLAPPLGQKRILAIDPGFRSGCKVVCLDKTGKLLHNDNIYPHPPQRESSLAIKKINNMVNAYDIEAIAIGNGTAGRETEILIERIKFNKDIIAVSVNEDGASVYSASSIAREEFPDYDVTVRGAVSIGRRLMDPLAELVKIDPKSIGVGQYQHDVDQKLLKRSLQTTIELCVNNVGVDLNSASKELLSHISGLGSKLASNIVSFRNKNGLFTNRKELLKVDGLGAKAFEQSAGFLRIKDGDNPLDYTAVHPEQYTIVTKIASKLGLSINQLVGNTDMISNVNTEEFISNSIGNSTFKDILKELEKPGRDPRKKFKTFKFDPNIKSINDVKPGTILPGIITNITAFGAFVDIGVKESALLHKSQIANEFVSNPGDYLRLNQQLQVKVIDVDIERKRIGLTLKEL